MELMMLSFLKPYLLYIYAGLFVVVLVYLGWQKWAFYSLESELESKTKSLEIANKALKDTIKANEQNAHFIQLLQRQRQDDLKMLKKIRQDNAYLKQRRKRLLETIKSIKDERLSEEDRKFIQALYPKEKNNEK